MMSVVGNALKMLLLKPHCESISINHVLEIMTQTTATHDIYFHSHQGVKTITVSKIPNIVSDYFNRNTLKIA